MLNRKLFILSALTALTPPSGAFAADQHFDLAGFLKCYNLVVLGDYDANTDVEGRFFVGKNLKVGGAGNFNTRPPSSACHYPAVFVAGDVNGSGPFNLNNAGSFIVGGRFNGFLNMNGAGADSQFIAAGGKTGTINGVKSIKEGSALLDPSECPGCRVTGASLSGASEIVSSSIKELTGRLAENKPNASMEVATDNNTGVFKTGGDKIAVFKVTADQLSAIDRIKFESDPSGSEAAIIIVEGRDVKIHADFLNGNAQGSGDGSPFDNVADNVVWVFPDAQKIDFARAFFGSVIAPEAHVTNHAGISGTSVFGSFAQGDAIHVPNVTYPFPDFGKGSADEGLSERMKSYEFFTEQMKSYQFFPDK